MQKPKRITKKSVGIALLVIIIVMQFFAIDKSNVTVDPAKDFVVQVKAPADVINILKVACYDCHSNESIYPWYTNVAPVSWWVKSHINDGRKHLNFSVWNDYNDKRKSKKIKECIEEIEEGEMPLKSYTIIHKDAELSKEQQKILVDFFNSLRTAPASEIAE